MKKTIILTIGIVFLLLLSGCTNTPENVAQRETDAVGTVIVSITETAAAMPPTETVIPPTETLHVTATPMILPTILRYQETATSALSTGLVTSSGTYNAGTLISLSPVSNSSVRPNQTFNLAVVVENTGTTIWTTSYRFVHSSGTQMSYATSYPLSTSVANGYETTVNFYMISPSEYGTYTQTWNLLDAYDAIVMTVSFNLTVGDTSNVTLEPTMTGTVTATQATQYANQMDYMCSDLDRSVQQGQGCEDYCKIYYPQKVNCYYLGTLNPTATPTVNQAATQNAAAAQTQAAAAQQTQAAAQQTQAAAAQLTQAAAAQQTQAAAMPTEETLPSNP